jgi:hypothetical protein
MDAGRWAPTLAGASGLGGLGVLLCALARWAHPPGPGGIAPALSGTMAPEGWVCLGAGLAGVALGVACALAGASRPDALGRLAPLTLAPAAAAAIAAGVLLWRLDGSATLEPTAAPRAALGVATAWLLIAAAAAAGVARGAPETA